MAQKELRTLADRVAARVGTAAVPPRAGAGGSHGSGNGNGNGNSLSNGISAGTGPGAAPRPATRSPVRAEPTIAGWRSAQPGQALMLMPGELHFGGEVQSLKTLLGSCVALTLWHPKRRIGGMCHFLLPSRQRPPGAGTDGRFGEEAVAELVAQLERRGSRPQEFVAHLYGGADTMADEVGVKLNVGERNIERGWALVDQYGFTLDGVDVGDNVPRTVSLGLASGTVECRRGNPH